MWKTFIWKVFCLNCWRENSKIWKEKKIDREKENHYCYFKSIYNEDKTWIGCHSETCKWEWFHLASVTLNESPKVTCIVQYLEKKGSHTAKKMKIAERKGWLRPINNCHAIMYSPKFIPLTHIIPMFHLWTPWKHKKTLGFSYIFRGGGQKCNFEQIWIKVTPKTINNTYFQSLYLQMIWVFLILFQTSILFYTPW